MGMSTALTFNSGYGYFLIHGFTMDKINNVTFIRGMKDTIIPGMTEGTFFHRKGIILHKNGK